MRRGHDGGADGNAGGSRPWPDCFGGLPEVVPRGLGGKEAPAARKVEPAAGGCSKPVLDAPDE